ncbi:GAF and ANTAR domain-containing protein [Asanoa sp. NPDC050611]|uniref:GAF and ANTAR domain-containing protein n=1 Tax=Asanoa sp. NPDC050611 TaxID=3157098 RepID=UPI00340C9D5E
MLTPVADYRESAERRARGDAQRRRAAAARRVAVQEHLRASAKWGPDPYGPMLLASFADLAPQLFGADDLNGVLTRIVKFTVDIVTGCDWASITLTRRGELVDALSNGTVADELDQVQFGSGQGPAIDAMAGTHPVYVADLGGPTRWPVLAGTAADLGVASALCHGLFVLQSAQWSAVGSLNLYGGTPDAFSETDQDFASIVAAYVAVAAAMSHRREEVDRREAALHRGLSSRDVIGQAKGILMERQRLSAGEAFDLLRHASQRLNRRVVDVARHLTDTGELPG